MNRSENNNSNINLMDNVNKNYKKPYFYDKKDINLQSRNQSYFNYHEQSFLRNTISKDKKTLLLDSSSSKLDLLNKDFIRNNKNTLVSTDCKSKEKKDKDYELSIFKSKQQKYTEIYGHKELSNKDLPKQLVNNTHNKSRNPTNQILSKGSVDKISISLSLNIPGKSKTIKQNVIAKPVEQNTYYAMDKKNLMNISNKLTESLREKNSGTTLMNNFLKIKQSASNFISLKKPDSSISILSKFVTKLDKKYSGVYKKEAMGVNYQEKSQPKIKASSNFDKTKTVLGSMNTNYINQNKVDKASEKNNRYFSYGK